MDAPRCGRALAAPLLVGVGAAFDFHAGIVSQAPSWMQRNGLEWVYRLSREPKRLWRRYLTQNPRFLVGFLRQYVRTLVGRGSAATRQVLPPTNLKGRVVLLTFLR